MGNALGTLFQDIADAIRLKTGDTAKLKPAEFSEKIESISTGGGGVGQLNITTGTLRPSSAIENVQHNLGAIPDIIVVVPTFVAGIGDFFAAATYSVSMTSMLGGGYLSRGWAVITGGTIASARSLGHDGTTDSSAANFGIVRSVDSQTFTLGGSFGKLRLEANGGIYQWVAISGITG